MILQALIAENEADSPFMNR